MKLIRGIFVVLLLMGFSVLMLSSLRLQLNSSLFHTTKCRSHDPLPKAVEQEESNPQLPKGDELDRDLFPVGLFDDKSCLSRYQSVLYRKKNQRRKPSSYLISKLRKYEARHKKCGPFTKWFNSSVKDLMMKSSGNNSSPNDSECKYIVWISFSGLGNRILTLASAFLYALLTDRVLLVDRGIDDIPDLFCEPFPETSWLLPLDFPLTNRFGGFNKRSSESYGNLLRTSTSSSSLGSSESYIYLHLVHDYGIHDKLFFCDQEQTFLQNVPFLMLKSNNYFIPSLFMVPSFQKELHNLFPEKEIVFHILGRYLFHPTNSVWGLITRYYQSYLSGADEIVGIQIRVFDKRPGPFKHVSDQILACTMKHGLLPKLQKKDSDDDLMIWGNRKNKTVAVLMTSLKLGYFDDVRKLYMEHQTENGELISFHQPTHEELQHSEKQDQNKKAWAEMYLLSLTDKLITSAWSTFGYVAQGLGNLKPWVLYKPENDSVPDPPCERVMSIEPCFHSPPNFDCKTRRTADTGTLLPHVRHCEDVPKGVKLFHS